MFALLLASALALAGTPVEIGAPARAFSLPVLNPTDATRAQLHDFTGIGAPDPHAAVVLYFFEPGAGDEHLDELSRYARKHDNVQFIGILSDPRGASAALNMVRDASPSFPVLSDVHRVVFARYGVREVPLTLIVDADAYVHAAGQPRKETLSKDLDAVLAPLLD